MLFWLQVENKTPDEVLNHAQTIIEEQLSLPGVIVNTQQLKMKSAPVLPISCLIMGGTQLSRHYYVKGGYSLQYKYAFCFIFPILCIH